MKVGIVGCGLIGKKRARALQSDDQLLAICDSQVQFAESLNRDCGVAAQVYTEWKDLLAHPGLEAVVIATPHNMLPIITAAAIEKGLAVLVEKPAARNPGEVREVISVAERKKAIVRVGFNHRYHPAFRKIRELQSVEKFGPLMFIRGRYGHGGRLGMEKEWRGRPEISGGGELIDQGVHMIDLSRLWLGQVSEVNGWSHNYFWQMPVEDNGFLLLKNKNQQAAFIQVSCTEWKNLFSFEIYFRDVKIDVSGLGGSYGTETLRYFKMLPQMGPPETQVFEFAGPDDSWNFEWAEFKKDVELRRQPDANLGDALAALEVVYETYRQSGQEIKC